MTTTVTVGSTTNNIANIWLYLLFSQSSCLCRSETCASVKMAAKKNLMASSAERHTSACWSLKGCSADMALELYGFASLMCLHEIWGGQL